MAVLDLQQQRVLMVAGSLAMVVWGLVGFYLGLNTGFSGGLYNPEYRVPEVWRGGLAEKSGFQAGDRVVSVEGIPVERLGMESRWPRALVPRIGDTRRFVVERGGKQVALDVVYPAPFKEARTNRLFAVLIGTAFLGFGGWSFLMVGTAQARTLAYMGLAAGLAMLLEMGPNLGSWNGVKGHASTAAMALMFILLLRFFVTFPRSKAVSRNRIAFGLVFGSWGCLIVFLAVELMVHPALYYTTGSVAGPMLLVYLLLALIALVHTLATTSRAELRQSGTYLVVAGLLFAVLENVATHLLGLQFPNWTSPLLISLIPLTMALAVRKQASMGGAGANAGEVTE